MDGLFDLVPGAVLLALLVWYALGDVTRNRLDRFARRQSLIITVANGPVVIGYLATIRRWRIAGVLAGLAVAFGASYTQRHPWNVHGASAIAGWFVGALAAELRMESKQRPSAHRTAALAARRLTDYIQQRWVVAAIASWAAALAYGVVATVTTRVDLKLAAFEMLLTLALSPVVWLVARHVVRRPQAVSALDVLAADDALRSRSVHVLAGCAIAGNGVLAAALGTYAAYGPLLGVMGAFVLPLLGYIVATSPFAAHRRPVYQTIGATA